MNGAFHSAQWHADPAHDNFTPSHRNSQRRPAECTSREVKLTSQSRFLHVGRRILEIGASSGRPRLHVRALQLGSINTKSRPLLLHFSHGHIFTPLCCNIGVEETGTLAADQPSAVSCVAAAQTSHVGFSDVGSLCMPPQKVGRAVVLGLEEGPPS